MLIGSITNQGSLSGQITNANGYLTGFITNAGMLGGQVIAERGLKGDQGNTGATGADGFSPSASVSKVGHTATITITDKDGTTTAEVYDGSGGGASAFIAEYGVTTYADVKDAYDEDKIIIVIGTDNLGNATIYQLAFIDSYDEVFYFARPIEDGVNWVCVESDDTWDATDFHFAPNETVTQLRDGLMTALDKQKLDGIASGAEVNVQSDWNEADSTADDYIKNKPTIPTKVSDLNNDSGFITGGTSTPTADEVSEFDSDAHMNSTDMSDSDVSDFVDGLNVSGGGVVKTNVTPTSGTNYSGYGNCYYEVLGKLVHFHIGIGGLTANTATKIYTMPSGLRPQTKIFAKGSDGSSLNYSGVELWDNGEIYVTSQGTYCGAELWYFV